MYSKKGAAVFARLSASIVSGPFEEKTGFGTGKATCAIMRPSLVRSHNLLRGTA
jgi:hypothetical protein